MGDYKIERIKLPKTDDIYAALESGNPIEKFIEDCTTQFQKQYNEYLEAQFVRHLGSLDKLKTLIEEDRVYRVCLGHREEFYLDNKLWFYIETHLVFEDTNDDCVVKGKHVLQCVDVLKTNPIMED